MAIVTSEGIVLKTHALGETSRIAVVYTRDHGLVKMVAKGARKTPSRFGYALEPLTRGRYVYYFKPDRDLHLLSQADTLTATGSRIADLERLAHAEAAIELIDRLVWGEEPHAELFDLLAAVLEAVTAAPVASLPALTIAFQLQVASLLGYRPRLDACAECGGALSQRRLFSPARGGLLCDRCVGGEPGTVALSADALAVWLAAVWMLSAISRVVVLCCSTADAMLVAAAVNCSMARVIEEISSTDLRVASWMAVTCCEISSVALDV